MADPPAGSPADSPLRRDLSLLVPRRRATRPLSARLLASRPLASLPLMRALLPEKLHAAANDDGRTESSAPLPLSFASSS
eukprot:CAMPEP_0115888546 /NCGR_PEP_ID=MMETSP0287-20121206/32361_1 /TAXON_ID=412157 /ORGANISM="Chrysochromulina rotalis, Strain UIO044" /LENGTH=79 /DNA_ID=CAMNT_0003345229 /DNA_START=431 /DNA_END=668 /DNA_ORIENTATION=-